MHRTTILLPTALRREAENVARARGITLSELIRQRLKTIVAGGASDRRAQDPLFRPGRLIETRGPRDISQKHDDYLYGPTRKPRSRKLTH